MSTSSILSAQIAALEPITPKLAEGTRIFCVGHIILLALPNGMAGNVPGAPAMKDIEAISGYLNALAEERAKQDGQGQTV